MPDPVLRVFTFPDCEIHLYEEYVVTVFPDGAMSVFAPPGVTVEASWSKEFESQCSAVNDFSAAMREMGYSSPMLYTIDNQIAHRFAVEALRTYPAPDCGVAPCELPGVQRRDALHKQQVDRYEDIWPYRAQDEEHLANSLQKYVNTGEKDSFNCLDMIFGERLPEVARRFVAVARPWLGLERVA